MDKSGDESDQSAERIVPQDNDGIRLLLENQVAFKNFLRRRLPSDAVAEDLLQQSILKAIRGPGGLGDKENPTAWFYRILRNSLTDFYRARSAEYRKHDAFMQNLIDTDERSRAGPDSELMDEVCACLNRLLPTLKPEYSDLLLRIDLKGESPQEVADSTGVTYNNLMVRLHRARQALRKSLELSCGACTRHGCLECTCGHGQAQTQGH